MQLERLPEKAAQPLIATASYFTSTTLPRSQGPRGRAEWPGTLTLFPAPGALAHPDHTLPLETQLCPTGFACDSDLHLPLRKWRELLQGYKEQAEPQKGAAVQRAPWRSSAMGRRSLSSLNLEGGGGARVIQLFQKCQLPDCQAVRPRDWWDGGA